MKKLETGIIHTRDDIGFIAHDKDDIDYLLRIAECAEECLIANDQPIDSEESFIRDCHHYSIDWLKNTMIERWNTRPEPRCDMCKTDCEYCLTYLNTDSNKDATEFYCADFEERE